MADTRFSASLDTQKFDAGAADILHQLGLIDKASQQSGNSIDSIAQKLTQGLAAVGVGFSAVSFVKQVAEVRGQFQQLEVAFKTMLGSKEQADDLMAQMVKTAATTPFDLQSVAAGAKQLLAFGASSQTVNDTLIRLGNIASGIGAPLQDIVYLYGTTMTQGRLYTQDLNQFTGRGIPMIKLLAEQFNVAESEVKGLVEAGKVGFPEVQKAIEQLTDEGGMFFNLMAEQSKTITGKISNLGDAFDTMFNDIGRASQDYITGGLDVAISLVENYKDIGRVLMELVAAYGLYKAVLIATTAAQRINKQVMAEAAVQKKLAAAANVTLSNSEAVAAARSVMFQRAQQGVVSALNRVKAAIASNPYALAAAGVATLAMGIYKLATYQSDYERSVGKMHAAQAESAAKAQDEIKTLDSLVESLRAAKDDTAAYQQVKDKIVDQFGRYNQGLEQELANVDNIDAAYASLKNQIEAFYDHKSYLAEKDRINTDYQERRAEALKKLYEELRGDMNLSDDEGAKLYKSITEGLGSGKVKVEWEAYEATKTDAHGGAYTTTEYRRVVKGLDEESQALFNKWRATSGELAKIEAITEATREYEKELTKLNEIFSHVKDNGQLPGEDGNGGGGNAQLATLEQIIAKIKEADKALANARKQAAKGEISTTKVSEAEKELQELKAKYKLMTGREFGKTDKSAATDDNPDITAARKKRKLQEDEIRARQKLENEAESLRISQMQDGIAKELALHEWKIKEQRQMVEQARREAVEAAKQHIEADTGKAYAGQAVKISEGTAANLARQSLLLDEREKVDAQKILASQYLSIVQKAAQEAAQAKSDVAILSKYGLGDQAAERQKQSEEEQNKFGEDYLKETGDYDRITKELSDLAASLANSAFVARLDSMITDAETQLAALKGQNEVPQERILQVRGKLELLKSTLKDVRKDSKGVTKESAATWSNLAQQLGNCGASLKELGADVGGVAGEVLDVLGGIADFASQAINSVVTIVTQSSGLMQTTAAGAAESIKTVERASVILAIISAALQLAQGIAKLFKQDDYMAEMLAKVDELNEKIDETLYKMRADSSKFGTIFGENTWAALCNNIGLAKEGLVQFEEVMSGLANQKFSLFLPIQTLGESSMRDRLGEAAQEMSDFELAQRRISLMRVQTRHSTWFRSAKYSTLQDLGVNLSTDMDTPEYMAALKEFQESDIFHKLDKANQEFINDAIEGWEHYQSALDAVKEQFSSWFGDMQTAIGDAITAGFEEGEDAVESFREKANESINEMIRQLVISSMVSPIFERYEDQLAKKMLDTGGSMDASDIADLTDILINFTDEVSAVIPSVSEAVEGASKRVDEMFGTTSEAAEGLSGAIQGASQESIDLLSGYCNAIRVQQMEALSVQRQSLLILSGINTSAASSAASLKEVVEILESNSGGDTLRASGL